MKLSIQNQWQINDNTSVSGFPHPLIWEIFERKNIWLLVPFLKNLKNTGSELHILEILSLTNNNNSHIF